MENIRVLDARSALVVGLGAHSYLRYINVAVRHSDFGKTLLGNCLTGSGELRNLTDVGSL